MWAYCSVVSWLGLYALHHVGLFVFTFLRCVNAYCACCCFAGLLFCCLLSPLCFGQGLEQFKRRVTAEGVEKELQKKRVCYWCGGGGAAVHAEVTDWVWCLQFYMKPNIRRRLNVENTRYFKARKEVIAEYMRLVRRGQVEKIPDSKF